MINVTSEIKFDSFWLLHSALNRTLVIGIATTGNVDVSNLGHLRPTLSKVDNENHITFEK
jgi:hypothetical protein